MYTKNNGSGENNVIQNRFTAYLLTAIHRKKATYLGACNNHHKGTHIHPVYQQIR